MIRSGYLRLSPLELTYQRQQFYESQELNGVPCLVYTMDGSHQDTHDFYGDIIDVSSYSHRFSTYITFDTHPTIKTLKSLGWYISTEDLPILAYIPVLYKTDDAQVNLYTPQIDDRIILPANLTIYRDVMRDEESFLIKKLVGQGYPDVVYYIANLVPYRRDL